VQGSRKRDPDAPGGSDPHPACWRPEPGGAALRLWAQALPSTPVRKALSTVWVVGQAGRRVGWPRPPVTPPSADVAAERRRHSLADARSMSDRRAPAAAHLDTQTAVSLLCVRAWAPSGGIPATGGDS